MVQFSVKNRISPVLDKMTFTSFTDRQAKRVVRETVSGLRLHTARFKKYLRATRFVGGDGITQRTRRLFNSVKARIDVSATGRTFTYVVSIGEEPPGTPQAKKQEDGGKISVKRGKYLTIPLDAAKDPKTHVPTFTSAYHIDFNTFVFRSKKGKRFIAARFPSYSEAVQELGLTRRPRIVLKQGRTVVLLLYLLRKRVTLPKRLKFKETFLSAPMVKDREERLSSAIQGSLSRAFARLG